MDFGFKSCFRPRLMLEVNSSKTATMEVSYLIDQRPDWLINFVKKCFKNRLLLFIRLKKQN